METAARSEIESREGLTPNEARLTWDRLYRIRRLGVDKVSKSALFVVPIVASAVSFARHHGLAVEMPVSLLTSYSAAFLFFLGSTVVDIQCPEQVREHQIYERYSEYCEREAQMISEAMRRRQSEREALMDQLRKVAGTSSGAQRQAIERALEKVALIDVESFFSEDSAKRWSTLVGSNPTMRAAAALLFLGAALVGFYVAAIDAPLHVIRLGI